MISRDLKEFVKAGLLVFEPDIKIQNYKQGTKVSGDWFLIFTAKTYLKNKTPNLAQWIKLLKAPVPTRLLLGKRADLVYFHLSSYSFKPLRFRSLTLFSSY